MFLVRWVQHLRGGPTPRHTRKRLPQSVRQNVWTQYVGPHFYGQCWVCDTRMDVFHFEASHMIAQARGGEDTVANLRPCCASCNRSMGTQDLEEFKRVYYARRA